MALTSANRMGRIQTWLGGCTDPDKCFQTIHGQYALADGGWWGVGLGASREKWSWLPAAHNDFIFAIIGEELGLPGTLVIIGLFGLLAFACYRLVLRSADFFVRVATAGVMVWILAQARHQHGCGHRAAAGHRCSASAGLQRGICLGGNAVCLGDVAVVRQERARLPRGPRRQAGRGETLARGHADAPRSQTMSPLPGLASVLLAGGGSAGHVSPLLALADCLRRRDPDLRITALGTEAGLEQRLVPARGYDLQTIPKVAFPRRPGAALVRLPGALKTAVDAAGAAMDKTSPDVVVGFGGYVSTPAYLAARDARSPSSSMSRTPGPVWPTAWVPG